MHFDFCIGNPPYQEEKHGGSNTSVPVFHYFMDAAYNLASVTELITPARFLFDGGMTPKHWNKKMLSNFHFKVMEYIPDSKLVFQNTSVNGGVVISYFDVNKEYRPILVFNIYPETNAILSKVLQTSFSFFDSIVSAVTEYQFSDLLFKEHPEVKEMLSVGNERVITSNLEKFLNIIFFLNKPIDGNCYVRVFCKLNSKRTYLWIDDRYLVKVPNFTHWKLFVASANGAAGVIGDSPASIIGLPVVAEPFVAHNRTFLSIGNFSSSSCAYACLKYLKSKFCRFLIGTLKVTNGLQKRVYANVPIQDFTDKSDIDWSKSVHEIDLQLYKKYGLSDEEIQFIEEKVKSME